MYWCIQSVKAEVVLRGRKNLQRAKSHNWPVSAIRILNWKRALRSSLTDYTQLSTSLKICIARQHCGIATEAVGVNMPLRWILKRFHGKCT